MQLKAKAEFELRKRIEKRSKDYISLVEFYRRNPLDYISERLGIKPETINWMLLEEYKEHKWDGTPNPLMKILDSLVNNRWIGVEAGTSVGKTLLLACIALWFLECFHEAIVVTTSPKRDQLSLHIWREIGRLYQKFGKGYLTSLKLRMIEDRDNWLAVGFVAGVKAGEVSTTKAQGFHSEHMLIIMEETPGIPEPIMTAFQNTATAEHNIIIAVGNPDHQLDNLHRFCKLAHVEHIRISGFDYPNVVLNNPNLIPGAQTKIGLQRMLEKYGDKEHPLYLSRARGISPTGNIESLIKIEWIRRAQELYREYCNDDGRLDGSLVEGEKSLGVDVANSEAGDKGAICYGKGNVCLNVEDFQCPDSNQLGHRVHRIMKDEEINSENIVVDGVGVGAGTVNTLKEYDIDEASINFQSAAAPLDLGIEEKFNNQRSQAWWMVREDLRHGRLLLPEDEELVADLVTPKYVVKKGKIQVESKLEIKKRLGHSPNKGDAFVMWNWNKYKQSEIKMAFIK